MCSNISKQRILNSFKWYKNLLESCRRAWNSKRMGQTAESRKECMHKHKMVDDKNQQIRKVIWDYKCLQKTRPGGSCTDQRARAHT